MRRGRMTLVSLGRQRHTVSSNSRDSKLFPFSRPARRRRSASFLRAVGVEPRYIWRRATERTALQPQRREARHVRPRPFCRGSEEVHAPRRRHSSSRRRRCCDAAARGERQSTSKRATSTSRRRTANAMRISSRRQAARMRPCSCGRTSSGCVPRSAKWVNGSPRTATACSS